MSRPAPVIFCLLAALATNALAEQRVVAEVPPRPDGVPTGETIVALARTTLLTLNDAVQTGNFTVLRDRGAPGFREANSAARLSQIFSDLLARRVDLSAVSIASPQLTQQPALNQETGTLFIKGHFPAPPTRIEFELLYEQAQGRWQLFGISVQVPASAVAAQGSPKAVPAPARKPKGTAPAPKRTESVTSKRARGRGR